MAGLSLTPLADIAFAFGQSIRDSLLGSTQVWHIWTISSRHIALVTGIPQCEPQHCHDLPMCTCSSIHVQLICPSFLI